MKFSVVILPTLLLMVSLATVGAIPDSLKQRIDSLKGFLSSDDLKVRYTAEFGIAWELFDVDNPLAAEFARRAFATARTISDTTIIVKSGRLFGQLLRRIDLPDSAVSVFATILPFAKRMREKGELGKISNALAVLYNYQGRFDSALVYNIESLKIRRQLGDSVGIGISLVNTGMSFYKLNNNVEAERYYSEALPLTDQYSLPALLLNMALLKILGKDSIGFVELSQRAIQVSPVNMVDQVTAPYHYGFGWHHFLGNRIDSSIARYRRAWKAADRIGDSRISAESRLGIGQCYERRAQYDSALLVLAGLESVLLTGKYWLLRLLYYDIMSTSLEHKGQVHAALRFRKLHRVLSDSITDRRITNNILMARLKFEEAESEKQLTRQAEIISLKEDIINRQNILLLLSVVLGLSLLSLAFFLYSFYRYQRRISVELNRKVRDRTKELKLSEDQLVRRVGEQRLLLGMISARTRASVATLRGLWDIAMSDSLNKNATSSRFNKVASDLLQTSEIVERSVESRNNLQSDQLELALNEHI